MRTTMIFVTLAMTAMLAVACEREGPAERAGEKIDETVEDVANAAEDACEDAKDAAGAEDDEC